MISSNQRHMLSYVIDNLFYQVGQESIDLGSERDRDKILTYFNNILDKEARDDVTYQITHGEPIEHFSNEVRQMIHSALVAAMRDFVDNNGKRLVTSYRGHRVALRTAFLKILKSYIADHQRIIEGREKALLQAKQERERLANGE